MLFPDIASACEVVQALKAHERIPSATELADYASLRLAGGALRDLVPGLHQTDAGAAALLIEVKGEGQEELDHKIAAVQGVMAGTGVKFGGQKGAPLPMDAYAFRKDAKVSRGVGAGVGVKEEGQVQGAGGSNKGPLSMDCLCL